MKFTTLCPSWLLIMAVASATALASSLALAASCATTNGEKQLLWGDLHVHTAWSLDAYAFGALANPEDAYRFARGEPLTLGSGLVARIDRPLDFTAVTDHAETFDLMYACTDPGESNDAYCTSLRDLRAKGQARPIFNDYLLPIVSLVPPSEPSLCDSVDCVALRANEWQRTQRAANEADDPCQFTALIGYEWTASPGGRHWHRNVIYRSAEVPAQTFDYVRYPEVGQLWQALEQSCQPAAGCDVLTIPHNINWADGGTFDLSNEPQATTRLRRQYERLAEIHQEKGSSECLPGTPDASSADCGFELVTANSAKLRMSGADTDPAAAWEAARQSYYRTLLGQGLIGTAESGANPFMLGAIGSTDTHFGTPGMVAEASYFGGIALLHASESTRLANSGFNPGGLVAVWAEENTRGSIFDALQRREAYATSGPRIRLRFGVGADLCTDPTAALSVAMGGVLDQSIAPTFSVMAASDQTPLSAIEVIKGEYQGSELTESVTRLVEHPAGKNSLCANWTDTDFESESAAYWYVRVLEMPSPRWSKLRCERLDNCSEFPDADRMIQERAWSSPIWHAGHTATN